MMQTVSFLIAILTNGIICSGLMTRPTLNIQSHLQMRISVLSFKQKILIGYLFVFLSFIILIFPFTTVWVHHIVFQIMETRATELIATIQHAPNNEALVKSLKEQQSLLFFRMSVITDQYQVLYDSHTTEFLTPKFSKNYIVNHPEVLQAFKEGLGYHEDYSAVLNQEFSYLAKTFDFHGHIYVLRAAFPLRYVLEAKHDFEIGFFSLAAMILFLFSLMTWYIIHYLTKPIYKVIQAVKPYQEGLQHSLPVINLGGLNPKDDFSKLAFTLNSLSTKIQKHINMVTEERNEKEAILESLVEGVIAVDGGMNIIYANYIALKFLNRSNQNIVAQQFALLGQEQCESLLLRCQEENKPLTCTLETFLGRKKLFLDVVAAPKKDDAGAILVLQDQTAHHTLLEMRRDFIANASHELKTPITVIQGFAEALHDNPTISQEMRELMTTKIVRNCVRMTSLIQDLLTLSDVENIPSFRLKLCDLCALVEHCGVLLKEIFPETQLSIERNHEKIALIIDPELLELAIMNLMENAVKYSDHPAYVRVVLNATAETVFLQVIDQGMGIPLMDQEHIFDRFYTVDKARSKEMGGVGLGLSIVKTIVDKHCGTITVESEVKKGTTFTITLPKITENHPQQGLFDDNYN